MDYKSLVETFGLLPHPEGGFYKEVYRSKENIPANALPETFLENRSFATGIYFLLLQNNFSAFHRIKSDEGWHFYEGGSLLVHIIHPDGKYELLKLGKNFTKGEVFQGMVPAGCWFASECAADAAFSFVGCTVSPGFDFADFELAHQSELVNFFPQHSAVIERLCRQ